MSSWLRLRVGPVGYTVSGRRRPQTYGQYKQSRERRETYAARYQREKLEAAEKLRRQRSGEALQAYEPLILIAAGLLVLLLVLLLSPVILAVYVVQRLLRAVRGTPTPQSSTGVSSLSADAARVEERKNEIVESAAGPTPPRQAIPHQMTANTPEKDRALPRASVAKTPRPKGWTIKGVTTAEFDGVTLPTLRHWMNFWNDEPRSVGRADEMARENPELYAGRTGEGHIRMIEAEIDARTNGRAE